jgi:hypothetical protein
MVCGESPEKLRTLHCVLKDLSLIRGFPSFGAAVLAGLSILHRTYFPRRGMVD